MLKSTGTVVLLSLLLVACSGRSPLFSKVEAPQGVLVKQQQGDISRCTTEAEDQANNSGDLAQSLFSKSGLEKGAVLERKIFAECMTAKGYTVIPVPAAKS
jgi:hypothetical protein